MNPETNAPARPFWKNPFILAFVLGAVVLTLLPNLQRRLLRAPPPILSLSDWELPLLAGGGTVGTRELGSRVWLLTLEPGPCDAACLARQQTFGRGVRHVDDLDGRVMLVSLVGEKAAPQLASMASNASPLWKMVGGSDEAQRPLVSQLSQAFARFTGRSAEDPARFHAVVLVDQRGAVRGFWPDDSAGRGNSINAARLLAREGPLVGAGATAANGAKQK